MEVYRQLKDEYFGFVRQAGELDLQLKEMEVCRRNFLLQIKLGKHSKKNTGLLGERCKKKGKKN